MGGEEVVRVVCVGEGPAGGLALLCGPWAALEFPRANVDVVTFATPWQGFNPQFAWAFEQLVVVHYLWPFAAPDTAQGAPAWLVGFLACLLACCAGLRCSTCRQPLRPASSLHAGLLHGRQCDRRACSRPPPRPPRASLVLQPACWRRPRLSTL